jgi:hypothetical protein
MKQFLVLFLISLFTLPSYAHGKIDYRLEINPTLKQQVEVAYIKSESEDKIKPIYLRIEWQDSINKIQMSLWGKGLKCETINNQKITKKCIINDETNQKNYSAEDVKNDMPQYHLIDLGYVNLKALKKQKIFTPKVQLNNDTTHVYTFDLKELKF